MYLLVTSAFSQEVDGGNGHSIILDEKGRVWTFGRNNHGQLGNGTFLNSSVPIQINLQKIQKISRGYDHSLALDSGGNIWCWGINDHGQLGVPGRRDIPFPFKLTGTSDFVAIEGAHRHSVALKKDGSVVSWGTNVSGELGSGDIKERNKPGTVLTVQGPLRNIVAIASVGAHSLALDSTGNVWGWGSNCFYQLSPDKKDAQMYAIRVEGIPKMRSVATGWHHSIGLDSAGNIWAWGSDPSGQFRETTTKFFQHPVKFQGVPEISEIACGSWHSLAIDTEGRVWAWGKNHFGMLGTNDTISASTPKKVSGIGKICKIGAGCFHSMAIDSEGKVWSFGDNPSGQLGLFSDKRKLSPNEMLLSTRKGIDEQRLAELKWDKFLRNISLNNLFLFLRENAPFCISIFLNVITAAFVYRRIKKSFRENRVA